MTGANAYGNDAGRQYTVRVPAAGFPAAQSGFDWEGHRFMSEHYHALVWIDHHEARIFQFNATDVDSTTVRSAHPHQHIHHKANTRGSGHAQVEEGFLERVTQALMRAGAILITGPANAKKELVEHIERVHPELGKRISGVETLDHPSDGELVALARRFFRADDRMHSQSGR
jgi:stalled ribosome rescue protein Dom34